MSIAELMKSKSSALQSVEHKSFYTAIRDLVRSYDKISKEGRLSLAFKPENILYVLTPKNGISFSMVDFASHPQDKSLEERNCAFHHHQLRHLSPLNPPVTYFFEIIVHLYMENILEGKDDWQRLNFVWSLWGRRHLKAIITPRPNIQSLFEKLEKCYGTIVTNEEGHAIWTKCDEVVRKVWKFKMDQEIRENQKTYSKDQCSGEYGQCALYDTLYNLFCAQYYSTKLNKQKKNKNEVGLCYDRHALGVLVLELIKVRGLSDGMRSTLSVSWAKKLMLGPETLEKVCKGFATVAKKKADKNPTKLDTSPCPLAELSYKIKNQSGRRLAGYDMHDLAKYGL